MSIHQTGPNQQKEQNSKKFKALDNTTEKKAKELRDSSTL